MNSTKAMTAEDMEIRTDRMRFIKNHLSANLALLAILFDVFYFVTVYRQDVGSYYYNIIIGASIIYNLLFMLTVFLCSEGVKNYKKNYSLIIFVVGVLQLVRIMILPMKAHVATTLIQNEEVRVMSDGQFMSLVVFLVASAVCCILAAAVNWSRCRQLEEHMNKLAAKTA